MTQFPSKPDKRRRGAIVVLAAILLVIMLGMIAFAVDIGYLGLARTELQASADSAALAAAATMTLPRDDMETVAEQFASYHTVGGRSLQLASEDVEYGSWDANTRVFTPSAQSGNAVRVTVRTDAKNSGVTPLFFGRLFGLSSLEQNASAVAMCNPRDIAFVVDLSGSMNDDTEPRNTDKLNSTFASVGYPTIGTNLMQKVYDDFGFGAYPGKSQWIGQPLGTPNSSEAFKKLYDKNGPLSKSTIPAPYRIYKKDKTDVRKYKAYSWTMDIQIPLVMPNVVPVPNSTASTSYSYWVSYLSANYRDIGYESYVGFMMYYGRNGKPDRKSYTPLSQHSSNCPWHTESTAGGDFKFPPREQPTHAARRSLIAALQIVKERNASISDTSQRDWVSIVTFDKNSNGVVLPLTGDYDSAMEASTRLQACESGYSSTDTEVGLITAANHIKPQNDGGKGRNMTNKIVVLLTDGMPNLYESSRGTIDSYVSANSSPYFYNSGSYAKQAPLMRASMMQGDRWYLFPVGIGLGTDYDFMDRMAQMGDTANDDGQSARGSGNPAEYEARLTEIFEDIITNPKLRLVQ